MALIMFLIFVTACDGILDVNDPGAIQLEELDDPEMEELIYNGVLSEFQYAFNYLTLTASILSDEVYTDHTNIDHREFALFDIRTTNILNQNTYTFLQKARVSAEDAAERIDGFDSADPLNVAHSLAYAGYSNILLGEHFCEVPINGGPAQPWQDIHQRALGQLEEARSRAQQALDQGHDASRARHIINLAQNGMARAHLQLGNMSQAIAHAQQVEDGFEAFVYRSSNSGRERNINAAQWITSDPWLSVDPRFRNLDDPRVAHIAEPLEGLNANDVYMPYRPRSYQGWSPLINQEINEGTGFIFASSLEARYIIAEASGPNAETLTFVNERREAGNQLPVTLEGDEMMAELRDQRARDFFLTVQRHGDIRRYLDLYGLDYFPTGAYPTGAGIYSNARCFIIPASEITGNPNIN